jgi:hypothetical protein
MGAKFANKTSHDNQFIFCIGKGVMLHCFSMELAQRRNGLGFAFKLLDLLCGI